MLGFTTVLARFRLEAAARGSENEAQLRGALFPETFAGPRGTHSGCRNALSYNGFGGVWMLVVIGLRMSLDGCQNAWFYNASQASWLIGAGGDVIIDMVLKAEDFEEKAPALKAAVPCLDLAGLKAPELQLRDVSKYYKAESTRLIMEWYFSADMALFGYKPLL